MFFRFRASFLDVFQLSCFETFMHIGAFLKCTSWCLNFHHLKLIFCLLIVLSACTVDCAITVCVSCILFFCVSYFVFLMFNFWCFVFFVFCLVLCTNKHVILIWDMVPAQSSSYQVKIKGLSSTEPCLFYCLFLVLLKEVFLHLWQFIIFVRNKKAYCKVL